MKNISFLAAVICLMMLLFYGCSQSDESQSSDNSNTDVSTSFSAGSDTKVSDNSPVDAAWFDDAVFVGDSVTLKLSYYCDNNPDALGNAQFFCAGSLGYTSALWDIDHENAVHPYYKGEVQLAENCAVVTGASKVFVMLGMNDVGLYGVDGAMESAEALIGKIKKNSPDAVIYIQSVTPILMGKESDSLNNEKIRAFNEELKEYCDKNGYKYLDIYGLLADENGYLPAEYCGDVDAMGIHFNDVSCGMWVDYLKENV